VTPEAPLRVAYVTCRYPPMISSGTFRVQAMMRHLPEFGVELAVITIPPAWVHQQTTDLEGPVPSDEPGVLRPEARTDPIVRALAARRGLRRIVREALIPDILAPWARGTAAKVARAVGEVDLVYATSPPFSAMILADRLADRLGVPCVQELRDPPSFNRRLRGRSRLTVRRMQRFEGKYLTRAAAVITVTPGTSAALLERHRQLDPGAMYVVMNGYPHVDVDPSLSTRDPGRFTVAYVGSFQGSDPGRPHSWFTPEIIIPALRALPGRPQLRIVGPVTSGQRGSLSRYEPGLIEMVGRVPRAVALAEIAAADVCVVLAEDDPWWIGRKVFEYMAFAKRILAVVPEGDTADLLATSPRAVVAPIGDLDTLSELVASLHRQWSAGREPNWSSGPQVQSDETCAEGVAAALRAVVGRHA
jgi:Glycosyl transferase 4-like domain